MPKVKIICTIGPAVSSLDSIVELSEAGMNVARLNFSHSCRKQHLKRIDYIKEAREKLGIPLGIMLDTKGHEIRSLRIEKKGFRVEKGTHIHLKKNKDIQERTDLSLTPDYLIDEIAEGARILIDDGLIIAKIIKKNEHGALLEIENDGVLYTGKSVNIPHFEFSFTSLPQCDIDDITFGLKHGIDSIAASFINDPRPILEIKKILRDHQASHIPVYAKIESQQGVDNFDAILGVADGIMVARGDLGMHTPLYTLPRLQKMMIQKGRAAKKPVIVATQLLESMTHHPFPTRAEVLDVSNAVIDGASALMLSGETAIGKYPKEAVTIMHTIIKESEHYLLPRKTFSPGGKIESFLSKEKPDAVLVIANNEKIIRSFSYIQSNIPIFALTDNYSLFCRLSLYRAIRPLYSQKKAIPFLNFEGTKLALCKETGKGTQVSFEIVAQSSLSTHA